MSIIDWIIFDIGNVVIDVCTAAVQYVVADDIRYYLKSL